MPGISWDARRLDFVSVVLSDPQYLPYSDRGQDSVNRIIGQKKHGRKTKVRSTAWFSWKYACLCAAGGIVTSSEDGSGHDAKHYTKTQV